jgi:hypothetical protein
MAGGIQNKGFLQPEVRTFTYSHPPVKEENIYRTINVLRRRTIMNQSQKTIPYRLSPAELENLRILRRRTQPAGSIQDAGGDEKKPEGLDARISDPDRTNQKVEKKVP